MSGLAGIVQLSPTAKVDEQQLRTMLSVLAVRDDCSLQTCCHPQKGIFVGRVSYGPCVHPVPPVPGGDAPRAFVAGEFLNDDAAGAASFDAYLLERYRASGGSHFAEGLNGGFAAVLVDPSQGRVILLTDPMNSCPIFVTTHEETLYFATEVKAFAALGHLPVKIDSASVLSMLASGQLMNLRTFLEGVECLDYSTCWVVCDGQVSRRSLWRFYLEDAPPDRGQEEYVRDLSAALRSAMARATRGGRVGMLLSGGGDSRTMLALLDDPSTVTAVTYTGRAEEHPAGDVAVARKLAASAGVEHHVVRYDGSQVLTAIRQSVYDADGAAGFIHQNIWERLRDDLGLEYLLIGDECFGRVGGSVRQADVLDSVAIHALGNCKALWPYLRRDRLEEFISINHKECRRLLEGRVGRVPCNQIDELWHDQGLCQGFAPKRRSLARHGLHVRLPLVDLGVLELLQTVPPRYRVGRRLIRRIGKTCRPDLWKVPFARYAEDIDYQSTLAALEADGGQVTSFLLDDNPLVGEFFDEVAVRQLVAETTSPQTASRRDWRLRLVDELPAPWRPWAVATARRYLGMRRPYLPSTSALLVGVMTVAEILRHVSHRCRQ